MARVLSCMQPTGAVHLGNFLGAVRRWAADQTPESFHGIVDLHALTTPQEPGAVREATLDLARVLVASGVGPPHSVVFVQSHVPEHTELAWLMECTAGFGELSRMTQFKDKSAANESFSAGLFTYPALMAADILLYDAEEVPVGADQRQHVELTRDLAQRFNSRHGETFVVPVAVVGAAGARVMDLQHPENKMSKSASSPQGIVNLLDDPKSIEKKFKRAVTDSDGEVFYDVAAKPGVSNLLSILAAATDGDPEQLAGGYTQYGPLKADTAAAVIEVLEPVQKRYRELEADPSQIDEILAAGAATAREVASATLARAKANIGLLPHA